MDSSVDAANDVRSFFLPFVNKKALVEMPLPRGFSSSTGSLGDRCLFLHTPDGKVFKVFLRKRNRELFLGSGWSEMTKYYSVGVFFFVVFNESSLGHFNIKILGYSTCEIDYWEIGASKEILRSGASTVFHLGVANCAGFCMEMKSSYVQKPFRLEFMLYVGDRKRDVSLSVGEDFTYFSKGWKVFVADNAVKEGDICQFVLTDPGYLVYTVVVSHRR